MVSAVDVSPSVLSATGALAADSALRLESYALSALPPILVLGVGEGGMCGLLYFSGPLYSIVGSPRVREYLER